MNKRCAILYAGKIDNRRYQKTNSQKEYDLITKEMTIVAFESIKKYIINANENKNWEFDIYAHCWDPKHESFAKNLLGKNLVKLVAQPVEITQPSMSIALSTKRVNELKQESGRKYDSVLWLRWDQIFKQSLVLDEMKLGYFWSASWYRIDLDSEDNFHWYGILNDHHMYHDMLADHWFYASSKDFNAWAEDTKLTNHNLFHVIAYNACLTADIPMKFSYHTQFISENMAREHYGNYKSNFEIIDFDKNKVNYDKKASMSGFKIKISKESAKSLYASYFAEANMTWRQQMNMKTYIYNFLQQEKKNNVR